MHRDLNSKPCIQQNRQLTSNALEEAAAALNPGKKSPLEKNILSSGGYTSVLVLNSLETQSLFNY